MHALKTTLTVPTDETVLEAEFGLYIYSHMSRDQLSALLESQGGYVEENKMLFFIRLLDEKDRNVNLTEKGIETKFLFAVIISLANTTILRAINNSTNSVLTFKIFIVARLRVIE